jgi:diadenylate cyclase
MHDGAVIVRNRRVAAASCFLPLTLNPRLSKELGTRHRAAIGITEDTDAIAVVVSEESGSISFVSRGDITRHVDSGRLRELLREAFEPARPFKDVLPAPRRRRRRRSTSRSGQSTEISPELSREVSSGG